MDVIVTLFVECSAHSINSGRQQPYIPSLALVHQFQYMIAVHIESIDPVSFLFYSVFICFGAVVGRVDYIVRPI